jgi:hypothetical protein
VSLWRRLFRRFFPPGPDDERFRAAVADAVEHYGWATVYLGTSIVLPLRYAYTVGLHGLFGAPEAVVIGQAEAVTRRMFDLVVERLRTGRPVEAGTMLDGPGGEPWTVRRARYPCRRFSLSLMDKYGVQPGDAVHQLIWPDPRNRSYPWDPAFGFPGLQPLLD